MRVVCLLFFVCTIIKVHAQHILFPGHLKKKYISKLQNNDSIVYYQCHVDEASQELTTSTGQKITSKKRKLTITEKFALYKQDSTYTVKYYASSVTNYPNKKFPYLTLTEVSNWGFELQKTKTLNQQEVLLIAAMETKTHDIVHYELNINKTCPNQIIVCYKKNREQYLVDGDYLLSKILNCQ
jgi:hypothetical protein